MNETQATFTDTEMPTIIPDTGTDCPKSDREITYLKKKNIDKAIRKKLRKKDVYETDMHNIYNLIAVQTNEQLHENAASDTTFQAVNSVQDPIGYLMILKKLCFSNQYEQHPILFL